MMSAKTVIIVMISSYGNCHKLLSLQQSKGEINMNVFLWRNVHNIIGEMFPVNELVVTNVLYFSCYHDMAAMAQTRPVPHIL